ncbi:BtpA/SgcQ family protein [Maribellus sediminis]|uniref:BtpA/SgcQ family protein n=1 Tax=Maribellus sediminis TaxID=2696285 RepID=UPI00143105C3|nr:BtpA/SgcQ family protein [Maribellus sediminis]
MMNAKKTIIAIVHVAALPGTPKSRFSIDQIVSKALADAKLLEQGGVDAIMIENMHDRPYLNRKVGAEVVSAMTAVAVALRSEINLPIGIQILAGANREALAVALAAGLNFIRAEAFVFGHLADEGMMNSDAGELLRYRKQIGAEHIKIYTDIKKKHSSHSLSADVSIAETAKAAEFFLSDGVIVTGSATGEKAAVSDLQEVRKAVKIPVLIGSGINAENLAEYWDLADAFIVGSSLKFDGNWENDVDAARVKQFMDIVVKLKNRFVE